MKDSDIDTSMTVVIGIVGTILIFVIVIALQAVYHRAEEAENVQKVVLVAPEELGRLRADQLELLNSYHWIDQKGGVVAIPIDEAMKLEARELNAERSAARDGSGR
ncbi:MAG: hypothetical protein AB1714_23280 [Acidobacteriota bacterium]